MELIDRVRKYINEATNHRNDGWVMKHYRDKLIEIYELIGSVIKKK